MKTEKEKMLAGEPYIGSDPELCRERDHAKKLIRQLNNGLDYALRGEILDQLLPNSSADIYIEPPFFVDYGYNVFCGRKVYFNADCLILDSVPVKIGERTLIGPGVHFYTATHPLNALERRETESAKPITIGCDCWIGGRAVICPGVTIGDRCVIAAGAVVTRDVPPDSLAAGNPAAVKRQLSR